MSREDPTWGAPRIQDSDSSVVGQRRAELSTLIEGGIIAMPILGGRIINTFGFEVFTKDSKQTYFRTVSRLKPISRATRRML
jgi:hypothetical protein